MLPTRPRPARALLAAALLAVLLAACGGEEVLTAEPLPTVPADLRPATGTPTLSPTPTPTPTVTPTPTPSPQATLPTDADRAEFVADYQPGNASGLEHVAVDLNGDGVEELVFTYVRRATGRAHVDVAAWRNTAYRIVFQDDGGPATRIQRVIVEDVNGDGATELATVQSGRETSSLSLWRATGEVVVQRLVARGGCADGSHTYGRFGAHLQNRSGGPAAEIVVRCDGRRTDIYSWRQGAYRHTASLGTEPPASPSPTPTATERSGLFGTGG